MSFISSTFSNLTINVGKGLANTGVNAAFYAANYRKRDGQLKFISNRGYSNVFVYAAKRTMMQMTFATINDLIPNIYASWTERMPPQPIRRTKVKSFRKS